MRTIVCTLAAALAAAIAASAAAQDAARIEPKFVGGSPVSESEMKSAVADDLKRYLAHGRHPSYIEDAAYRVLVLLRGMGYHNARVLHRVSAERAGLVAVFETLPGPLVEFKGVAFEGNEAVSTDELEKFFQSERRLPIELGKRPYVERRVKNAVSDIESLYRDRGYLWVKAAIKETSWSRARDEVRVAVKIAEGPVATLKAIDVNLPGKLGKILGDLVNPGLPCAFSPAMPLKFRNSILRYMAEMGFPFCTASVEALMGDPAPGDSEVEVQVAISVDPGKLARIDAVGTEGNALTVNRVVRYVSGFSQGQVYSLDQVRRAQTRLMRTGLFVSVDVEPVPSHKGGGLIDLMLRVKEADDWEITAEFNHGDFAIFTTRAKLLNRNLFGSGRKAWLDASLDLGDTSAVTRGLLGFSERAPEWKYWDFRAGSLEASLSDPWFFYTPIGVQLTWKAEQRAMTSYKVRRDRFMMPLTYNVSDEVRLQLTYEYRNETVFDVLPGVSGAGPRYFSVSSLEAALIYDGRDDQFDPKNGVRVLLSQEFAGWFLGGTMNFNRTRAQAYAYISPLGRLFTLVAGFDAGIIDPRGDTAEIPISLRYSGGGDSSVRSFWFERLGPKAADGTPLGSTAYLQFNTEIRVPVWWIFGFAAFFEGASMKANPAYWLVFNDKRIGPDEEFRLCVGMGLRVNTPVGPIRLDFGVNPAPLPGEDPWAVHFSVGHPF